MRKTFIAAILSMLMLAACSSQPKAAFQSIPDALRAEGITYTEMQSGGSTLKLQGVEPLNYKLENGEVVTVYAFDSAAQREDGYQDYLKHQQFQSSHAPIVFETGSFLVLYVNKADSSAQTAEVSETQYGEKIGQAVKRIK